MHHSETTVEDTTTPHDNTENIENSNNPTTTIEETEEQNDEQTTMDDEEEHGPPMKNTNTKWKIVSAKWPHQTDSDSDSDPVILPRKQQNKPRLNLNTARRVWKNADDTKKS